MKKRLYILIPVLLVPLGLVALLLFASASLATAASAGPVPLSPNADTFGWKVLAPLSTTLDQPGVVALNNVIHIIGGSTASGTEVVTHTIYDPTSNTYSPALNLPVARKDAAVAVVGTSIYVFGGYNQGSVIGSSYRLDAGSSSWFPLTAMPTPVRGAGVAVISPTIYIIGGMTTGGNILNTVQTYNTSNNSWSTLAPLNQARAELGAAAVNGLIYAIGGITTTGTSTPTVTMEVLDPSVTSPAWVPGPPLPSPRADMAFAVRNGFIYVIGGTDGKAAQNTNFAFNANVLTTTVWQTRNPIPTARIGARADVIKDHIYVIGGQNSNANEAYGFKYILYLPIIFNQAGG